jgi:arylsulfatase A-like enzyme
MIGKNDVAADLLCALLDRRKVIEDPRLPWLTRPKRQCRPGRIAILALIAGLLIPGAWHLPRMPQAHAAPPGRTVPNLLLIIADDQSGLCLGAAGDRRGATPHLDALARQGVLFDRAFCNSPLCTPSRQSFITGLLPHAAGVTRLETRLPEKALTLGQWLGILGYRTAAIGKMHFNGPSRHGFDTRIDVDQWLAHLEQHPPAGGDHRKAWRPFIDPAAVWLNARCEDHGLPAEAMESTYFVDRAIEYMNQNRGHPFAMVVSFYDPHAPFHFPREWLGRYRPRQFSVPPISERDREEQPKVFRTLTNDDFQGIQAAYYSSLAFMDFQVGRLIQALEDSGLGSDTLVVFLSDNGYLLGQHGRVEKNCFYEPAVRVPLIMRWPVHLPQGKHIHDMVELVDLFPTVCRLLDVPSPPVLQGTDLVPLIEGKPGAKGRDVVFSEYNESEEAMVRSARFKLIVGSGRRERKDHLETGRPLSGPFQKLFDLERDPDETTDLSDEPHLTPLKNDLLHRMYERLVSTWTGPEPIPRGLSELETIHWCLSPRDK